MQILCLTALENLPDSISRRRAILRAIISQFHDAADPVRQKAFLLLKLLDTFDAEQRELPFSGGKGDGQ